MSWRDFVVGLGVALFLGCASPDTAAQDADASPPVEALFGDPVIDEVQLSPDGQHFAAVLKEQQQRRLITVDIRSRTQRLVTTNAVEGFFWLSNDRLLVDQGLDGLVSVGLDGSGSTRLMKALFNRGTSEVKLRFLEPFEFPRPEGVSVLVGCTEWGLWTPVRRLMPYVYRLDVRTGKARLEVRNPGTVVSWLADWNQVVRLGLAIEGEEGVLLHRGPAGKAWKEVLRFALLDDEVIPLAFKPDNRGVYVAARRDGNTVGIHIFDPERRTFTECVWRHDRYDLQGVFCQRETGELLGVRYQAERPRVDWFNGRMKALQAVVDEALPGRFNLPLWPDPAATRLLYFSSGDRYPGAYYILHTDRRELELFASRLPWLEPERLVPVEAVRYPARDGLEIPGYLTFPRGGVRTNLPLVLMPHGGPWKRDEWLFDPTVQLLASRGYAVLQPNFRGSTGYGSAFERAGFREFGGAMQDDVTDGVRWAVAQGIANPKRVAIFGASYGGYAAMVGLTQTPELYRCGISLAGVSDLRRQLDRHAGSGSAFVRSSYRARVGDLRSDRDRLRDASPLTHVAQIQAPVMLIHGGLDDVVPVEQGAKLEQALKKHGKQFEVVSFPEEGHGIARETNRFRLFHRIETFLKRHL